MITRVCIEKNILAAATAPSNERRRGKSNRSNGKPLSSLSIIIIHKTSTRSKKKSNVSQRPWTDRAISRLRRNSIDRWWKREKHPERKALPRACLTRLSEQPPIFAVRFGFERIESLPQSSRSSAGFACCFGFLLFELAGKPFRHWLTRLTRMTETNTTKKNRSRTTTMVVSKPSLSRHCYWE